MAGIREKVMVDVVFSADTGQAKSQLQDLKNTLNSLSTQTFSGSTLQPRTQEIRQGQEAALRLKSALEQATNVDTGRLNLTNFTQSLHKSGMSLQQYANKLTALGPAGEKAFLQTTP